MVADGDAMGVASEIAQYHFRASEGGLGVDDPIRFKQLPD